MKDISRWKAPEDEDVYALPDQDDLGVLSSTRLVVEQGEYVWINKEQVEQLSEQWIHTLSSSDEQQTPATSLWDNTYHFYDGTERTVNWLLVLDALNFCFWAEKDRPRWIIEYEGKVLNGYWAEAAALTSAVASGIPLWDAEYLCEISTDVMASIFRPASGASSIPLFEQRVRNIREVGRVLSEKYNGQFVHAIEQVEGNAVRLARLLAHDFSSFNDVVSYRHHEVRFFKRAQICVADLHGSFHGKPLPTSRGLALTDLDKLTIFADYKLPQVLRHYNVLEYHPMLAERVDNQEVIEAGSEEEVEIRAATVWACELLRQAMAQHGYKMNALEIDQRLWMLGQHADGMRPYHRTLTQYY